MVNVGYKFETMIYLLNKNKYSKMLGLRIHEILSSLFLI